MIRSGMNRKRRRIIRRGWLLVAAILVFTGCAAAEPRIPSFSGFADIPGEACVRTESGETVTLQCVTGREQIEKYRLLVAEYGFLACGSWTLPAGDGYRYGEMNAYLHPSAPPDCRFTMAADPEVRVLCHLFIQHFCLEDGSSVVFITWSRNMPVDELKKRTPAETPAPDPDPLLEPAAEGPCPICHQTGKCRYCEDGKVHARYLELFVNHDVWIKCGECGGSGKCQYCGGDGIIP